MFSSWYLWWQRTWYKLAAWWPLVWRKTLEADAAAYAEECGALAEAFLEQRDKADDWRERFEHSAEENRKLRRQLGESHRRVSRLLAKLAEVLRRESKLRSALIRFADSLKETKCH